MPSVPTNGNIFRTDETGTYLWDVDEDLWPEGMWIKVCPECHRGPLNDSDDFCGIDECNG